MENIFFDSWSSIIRTLIITVLAYVILIVMLRTSGKRTLSKMNAFDFIITIALGSTFATVCLNKDVALIDGALALFLMIFMQYVVTWLSVRYRSIKELVTNEPAMLLYRGSIINKVLLKERVTIEEIHVAARQQGIENLSDIDAIILETTGELTVVKNMHSNQPETFKNVHKKIPTHENL